MSSNNSNEVFFEEGVTSAVKIVLNVIPCIGPVLNEAFLDFPERIRQRRINEFVELFKQGIEEYNPTINYEHLNSEEFIDILASIVQRVMKTSSNEKLNRYKKILLNEMSASYKSDFKETFLDIIERINEKQIQILLEYKKFIENDETIEGGTLPHGMLVQKDGPNFKEEKLAKHKSGSYFGINDAEYLFYVQDLISKGLLLDDGMGRVSTSSYQILKITQFGLEFLRFIEES